MNYNKAQKEIFEALLKGKRVCKYFIDDANVFVTADGAKGFIFPVASVMFNAEKLRDINDLKIAEVVKDGNELVLTEDMRISSDGKTLMRRLKGNRKNVFVNIKFLGYFHNAKYWQADDARGIIVVTENMSANIKNIPVGVIMPITERRIAQDYYND